MKRSTAVIIAIAMLLCLSACTPPENFRVGVVGDEPTAPPAPTEPVRPTEPSAPTAPPEPTAPPVPTAPPEPTAAPTPETTEQPEPTEAPLDGYEFVTGGVDYCEELELGKTYYFDLDGNGYCDSVYYGIYEDGASYWLGCPCLSITLDAFPNDPYRFIVSSDCDGGRVWAIDSDPDDGVVELLCADSVDGGISSCILIPQGASNGFRAVNAHGAFIDGGHPFSTDDGFTVCFWTQLFGTHLLEGRMKFSWYENDNDYVVRSGEAYYYDPEMIEESCELKLKLTGNLVNEDGSLGESVTLEAGEKVIPYATDNESFIDLRTEDGRTVRFTIELGDWSVAEEYPDMLVYPWYIDGVLQDLIADMRYSG